VITGTTTVPPANPTAKALMIARAAARMDLILGIFPHLYT
jgi:hypothetical protein